MTASSTLTPHDLAPRLDPVRVSLSTSVVVRAGLDSLLGPWPDRVELLADHEYRRAHVDVFEPDDERAGRRPPDVPRIALSWDPRPAAVTRACDLGAAVVLPLSVGADRLLEVVEQVHHDRVAATGLRPGRPALSSREHDVIRGVCRGLSNAEIAAQLDLSVNSVKTYVRTAYRKMGVGSRSQAVLWGVTHGL
ncbi:response regulator transcription factor [Nocardioides sp. C4-1]|uniref:helix-turn-helix transcriptional regulator n=1 Tax=Nocardioides sp. C4-1 TaxID=3151851 RepID=UPI003263673B